MTTALDLAVLAFLSTPQTCTELGEHLWSHRKVFVNRQSWARPAGKIIQRLVREGKVERVFPFGWQKRAAQYQAIQRLREINNL